MNLDFFYTKALQICHTNPAERGQRRPCFVEIIALLMSSQRFVKWKHGQIIFLVTRAQKSLREKWFLPFLSVLGRGQTGSCLFISTAPWCSSRSFWYGLHLPLLRLQDSLAAVCGRSINLSSAAITARLSDWLFQESQFVFIFLVYLW